MSRNGPSLMVIGRTHVERLPEVTSVRQHRAAVVCGIVVRRGTLGVGSGGCAEDKECQPEVPNAVHIGSTE